MWQNLLIMKTEKPYTEYIAEVVLSLNYFSNIDIRN